jgi:tetratricopeptide (TPR) repeat protein
MKTRASVGAGVLAIVLPAALMSLAVRAQAPDQVERRLQSVGTLIESSSVARQIDSSGVGAARERRETARLLHSEATAALQRGDAAAAARLLDEAAREMMAGARLARPEQVAGEKDQRDYTLRLQSARALLAAQQRITQEKSAGREAQDATRQIEQQIAEGERLAAAGRVAEARVLVDRAYLTARVSIESLRRGDTLVRSLNFASAREEYDYEIDRHDTHGMLIKVLLADRKEASPQMQASIDRSALLRKDAEALARRGDHAGAIKVLEDATRELVRAIRAGGLYIPG